LKIKKFNVFSHGHCVHVHDYRRVHDEPHDVPSLVLFLQIPMPKMYQLHPNPNQTQALHTANPLIRRLVEDGFANTMFSKRPF
jgi:hypothetical protein